MNIEHSTLDVRCSSLKPTPHGMNTTFNWLQNNIALMGFIAVRMGCPKDENRIVIIRIN
jgi:hypothetical protein